MFLLASKLFKYRNFSEANQILKIYLSKNKLLSIDPFNTFDWIMDLSDKNNIKSSFYFMTGTSKLGKDSNYSLDNKIIKDLLIHISNRGHNVGIHPSYYSYNDPILIKNEAILFQKFCK